MLHSFVVEGSHDGCEVAALAKLRSSVLCYRVLAIVFSRSCSEFKFDMVFVAVFGQVRAVSTEDVRVELTLPDKAVSSILLQRTEFSSGIQFWLPEPKHVWQGSSKDYLKRKERNLRRQKI